MRRGDRIARVALIESRGKALRTPLRIGGVAAIAVGLACFGILWALSSDGTEPAAAVFAARWVPLTWCVVIVGAGVVLLLVSALLGGEQGSVNER
jgi:hypothetical protein